MLCECIVQASCGVCKIIYEEEIRDVRKQSRVSDTDLSRFLGVRINDVGWESEQLYLGE